MNIVECGMCYSLHHIEDWKESNVFICKNCAEVLSIIKQKEIKYSIELSDKGRLKVFKILREID